MTPARPILSTDEHEAHRVLFETINMQIDLMVRTYDSRVLAAALLHRGARLYNGLWLNRIIDEGQVNRAFELALGFALDENSDVPRLVTKKEPGVASQ